MINIFRSDYDAEINEFHGRKFVNRDEVKICTKRKTKNEKLYTYAEPSKPGRWAFGGTILFTSDNSYPEFNTPIKLHDRNMSLEK
jgi:hypothetical protein